MRPISRPLLKWFDKFSRHYLPWQTEQDTPNNTYHVWLSEIMLQQTQVTTVIDYFNNFIQHFPTLVSLARASEDSVLAQWAGLGYYSKARNIHTTDNIIMNQYQGNFTTKFKQIIDLHGVWANPQQVLFYPLALIKTMPYLMAMLNVYFQDTIKLKVITDKAKHLKNFDT